MKKLLSMVLCAMMALTLAGCGGSSEIAFLTFKLAKSAFSKFG